MTNLTRRQRAIYDFIVGQVRLDGIPPTLMEIARAFDLSSAAGVADHLKAIERKGFIRRRPGASRGIELAHGERPRKQRRSVGVPLVAGVPSARGLSKAGPRVVYVDGRLVGSKAIAVQVRSGSLGQHGILQGDVLVVDCGAKGRRGDLLLGLQAHRVLLMEMADGERTAVPLAGRLAPGIDLEVVGRVVSVIRDLNQHPFSLTLDGRHPHGWGDVSR